jgi:probable F420-dependent oxidoreductase
MRIDKTFDTYDPATFVEQATELEAAGYDGLVLGEAANDPLVGLSVAARETSRVDLVAGVLIALPRSPLHVAYAANDLQNFSDGRFVLGLGSQIQAHIEKRFSSVWTKPVGQMREFVLAVKAIFAAWESDTRLSFEGEHYRHTLMPPYFRPVLSEHGCPPIWLAGVGPKMVRAAGEVAEGLFVHPFTSESYLREQLLSWATEGRASAGRSDAVQVALPVLVGVGEDDERREAAVTAVRKQLAFYGSTPAYQVVLSHHGWQDLQPELNAMSKAGRWDEMASLIDDDMLDAFAVTGDPATVGKEIARRFGDILTRVSIYTPNYDASPRAMAELMETVRANLG